MLHLPTPTLIGGGANDLEAAWVAHVTALAVNGAATWSGSATPNGALRTVPTAAPSGNMWGSPWGTYYMTSFAPVSRVIQHALPSEAVLNAQIAAGRPIFFRALDWGSEPGWFNSVARNGYTSLNWNAEPYAAGYLTEVLYFDGAEAWRMQPFGTLGPIPYAWS